MTKIILVVDDELAALRRSHISGVVGDFYDTLSDVNDPIFENLCPIVLMFLLLNERKK